MVADLHHFNEDPEPAFNFNADPDPAFHFNADPDSTCMSSKKLKTLVKVKMQVNLIKRIRNPILNISFH
jgi:hypothetical protein